MNNNLSNFSIENLFSDKKNGTIPNFTGHIDIKTLFQNDNDNQNFDFDSKILLNSIYEKRDKLQKYYESILKKCWETIKYANKLGYTEITYEIPKFSEYIGYSCRECIENLKKKLEEKKFDVIKINSRSISISWRQLENKINDTNTNANANINTNANANVFMQNFYK
jgi:hypothetical protein